MRTIEGEKRPMEELFFLVTKRSPDSPIETIGCVTRTAAHTMGFVHTSVLLIPVTWDEQQDKPAVFIHKRSNVKRTSPNTWDFCGGHLSFSDWHCQYLQSELDSTHILERLAEEPRAPGSERGAQVCSTISIPVEAPA